MFARADLVISRSGAHTTYELLTLKKPALLIPIPWVSHNEQYKNALLIKECGLGEILLQKELNKGKLLVTVNEMLKKLPSYGDKKGLLKHTPSDAVRIIVDETLSVAKGKTSSK